MSKGSLEARRDLQSLVLLRKRQNGRGGWGPCGVPTL